MIMSTILSILGFFLVIGIVIGVIAFVVPPIVILWKKWVTWLEKKLNKDFRDY